MYEDGKIYLGTSRNPDDKTLSKPEYFNLKLANRHGLSYRRHRHR